jgi:hypothetical protein
MDAQSNFTDTFLIYDTVAGRLLATDPVPSTPQRFMIDYLWITANDTPYIAVLYNDQQWALLDPITGVSQPMDGAPQYYAALSPDISLSLVPVVNEQGLYDWQAYDASGAFVNQFSSASTPRSGRITLSPSGQTVAFSGYFPETGVFENVVRVLRGDLGANLPDVSDDPFVSKIVWGPMAWRVGPSPNPADLVSATPLALVEQCPGFVTSRLLPGGEALVLGSSANNVRSAPSITAPRVGSIPGGTIFTVLQGPVCADNYAWWQVNYNGLNGWTAEGQGADYWLEPMG